MKSCFLQRLKKPFRPSLCLFGDLYGLKSAEKFVEQAYGKIDLISANPYLYKALGNDPDVRRAFITPQCSLVYKIHPNHIYLLYFWDNRQQQIP